MVPRGWFPKRVQSRWTSFLVGGQFGFWGFQSSQMLPNGRPARCEKLMSRWYAFLSSVSILVTRCCQIRVAMVRIGGSVKFLEFASLAVPIEVDVVEHCLKIDVGRHVDYTSTTSAKKQGKRGREQGSGSGSFPSSGPLPKSSSNFSGPKGNGE